MELWEALSKRRKEIGMQFTELEKASGLSISTLKKILGGHVSAPSYESVQSIAYAMKMSMADLDRMIVEGDDQNDSLSPKALALAKAYDTLSPYGKSMIDCILENEAAYVIRKKMPVINMSDPSEMMMKYLRDKREKDIQQLNDSYDKALADAIENGLIAPSKSGADFE